MAKKEEYIEPILNEKVLEDVTSRFFELKTEADGLKKEFEPLGKRIKNFFEGRVTSRKLPNGYEVIIGEQDKSKLNESKAIMFLKDRGFHDVLETKVVINEDKLERLVYDEVITNQELLEITDTKFVATLKVKKIK